MAHEPRKRRLEGKARSRRHVDHDHRGWFVLCVPSIDAAALALTSSSLFFSGGLYVLDVQTNEVLSHLPHVSDLA